MSTHGVIIGGGIAGLAAGILCCAQSINAVIYEQKEALNTDQHLLWIAPNGLHLLHDLGILPEVLSASVPQAGMVFASRNLKPLMTLRGSYLEKACGFPIVAIPRKVLWQLLLRRFGEMGGSICWNQSVTEIIPHSHEVRYRLKHEQKFRTAPWLLGADGMGSHVRKTMAPESLVEYQGLRTWLGLSRTSVASKYIGQTIEAWGTGSRFVFTSIDGETIHFSALERAPHYESHQTPIPENVIERLQALYSSFHPDVHTIMKHADLGSIVRCNFGVVQKLPHPAWGRICLIGDAAHGMPPNMGQGASLALEDAFWVTHLLKTNADPSKAFEQYVYGRMRRIAEMRRLANAMNTLFQPRSRWASYVRDSLAFMVPDSLTAKRMGTLYQPARPA